MLKILYETATVMKYFGFIIRFNQNIFASFCLPVNIRHTFLYFFGVIFLPHELIKKDVLYKKELLI